MKGLSIFPLLIYIFTHLFMSVFYCGYLLSTLGYDPVLYCVIAQVVPVLAIGSSFGWFLCPFDILPSLVSVFLSGLFF